MHLNDSTFLGSRSGGALKGPTKFWYIPNTTGKKNFSGRWCSTAEIRQVRTVQTLQSPSLTRYWFWNATTPEKLKGQLLSKHDANMSLSLLGAPTWIPEVVGDVATHYQQAPRHCLWHNSHYRSKANSNFLGRRQGHPEAMQNQGMVTKQWKVYRITELGVGRDLCRSSSPSPCQGRVS